MFYDITIAGCKRSLPLCPITSDIYIAGFVIFGDTELSGAVARELLNKAPEYDFLLTAESKGIPIVHDMSRISGENTYIVARKAAKLYMRDIFSVHVKSITTDNVQTLYLDGKDAERMNGKRVLIVDDVISTGASLRALEELVQKAGGIIAGKMAVLAEGDACGRDDIIYLEKLPLFNAKGEIIG